MVSLGHLLFNNMAIKTQHTPPKGWHANYVKPKSNSVFYDIEIIVDNQSRILRRLYWNDRFNFFYNADTEEEFNRVDVLNWKLNADL